MTVCGSRLVHRGGFVVAAILCGCRPATEQPRSVEASEVPRPASLPCELDAFPVALGVTAYRWPDGGACQVLLTGDQDTLAPLMPLVAGALEGFAGRRHLSIVMPNLRSLAGIERLPPLDALEIRDTPLVDLSPLTQGDRAAPSVARLAALMVLDTRIVDVAGLRALTTLERLGLSRNRDLRDLRDLRGLTRLRWLALNSTAVADLSPLAGLTLLARLTVSRWQDKAGRLSLRPIAGLRQLEHLAVHDWESTDLASLRGLDVLASLELRIGDELGPIPDLPRLSDLNLSSESLTSVEPLRRAPRLESLILDVPVPTPLTPLAGISTLRRLNVIRHVTRDDKAEAQLAALHELRPELRARPPRPDSPEVSLYRSPMDDYREVILTNAEESLAPFVPFVVESFSGFTGEKHLVIRMENLRSVAGIENMPPLDELRIHRTQVVDVDPLTRGERPAPAVMALQRLKLTDSRIVDISGLRTLLALERVDLSGNPDLRDVSALGRMKRLYSLSLMGTDLPDLAALAGLTGLTSLSVSWQRRSAAPLSLRPLASLRHLGSLLIGGREGADLAALRTLVVLEDLDIDIGDDLGAIPDLPRLRELNIDSEKLTSVAPLRRARRLEILSLGVEQPVRLTPLADIATLRRLYVASGSWADFLEAERAALNNIRPDLIYKD